MRSDEAPAVAGPSYDFDALVDRGAKRAKALPRRLGIGEAELRGARILEFGCGFGEVTAALAELYGASACGVDIEPRWKKGPHGDKGHLYRQLDITSGKDLARLDVGTFDFIHSYTVLEHVRRPRAAISALYKLLRPGGMAYLNYNLYRGASASHLMQALNMPWVHLTHSDEEIRELMRKCHGIDRGACWVNKLTYAHYLLYFDEIGFRVHSAWYDRYEVPKELYAKYEDVFSRYPEEDLTRNFMHVRLEKPA